MSPSTRQLVVAVAHWSAVGVALPVVGAAALISLRTEAVSLATKEEADGATASDLRRVRQGLRLLSSRSGALERSTDSQDRLWTTGEGTEATVRRTTGGGLRDRSRGPRRSGVGAKLCCVKKDRTM